MERTSAEGKGKGQVGKAIIMAFLAALIIKFFICDLMIAEGHSMVPTIKPGKILLVCKIYYGLRLPGSGIYLVRWGVPRKGHVVVFYTPFGDLAVKRCGDPLPENVFYALGDNQAQSYDSRNYGPVADDNIIGKVLGIR